MALPAIHQKISNLRQEVLESQYLEIEQARQFAILADRMTKLELAIAHDGVKISGYGPTVGSSPSDGGTESCMCSPEGYELRKGVTVAPITLVAGDVAPVRGAAFSALVTSLVNEENEDTE